MSSPANDTQPVKPQLGLWDAGMLNKLKYYDGSIQEISDIPMELKRKYKEVFEIDGRWLIEAAARRGRWMDRALRRGRDPWPASSGGVLFLRCAELGVISRGRGAAANQRYARGRRCIRASACNRP